MTGILVFLASVMAASVFVLGLKQCFINQNEIWEKYPDEVVSLVAYIEAVVLGLMIFRESGFSLVRLLYANVPTAEELGGKVYLNLSFATLPLALLIIVPLCFLLKAVGRLGLNRSLSNAQARMKERAERKAERIARIERKLQKEKEVKINLKRQTPR